MLSRSIALAYHQATKHTRESLRSNAYGLDWNSMPDPWRHYLGAPIIDLPANSPAPEITTLEALHGIEGPAIAQGPALLSSLFFHSAAVSASKLVPSTGYRYALRVNPSSGNLHPTEFHFITRGLHGWEDGVYHYRPSDHTAEQRAKGFEPSLFPQSQLVIVLTSIAWREAWKYRSRAYRYCCHDLGHAQESVRLAAAALGITLTFHSTFDDDTVTQALHLPSDEWPMGILASTAQATTSGPIEWTPGTPNQLSQAPIEYPLIASVHAATRVSTSHQTPINNVPGPIASSPGFAHTVRTRRSALNFRGHDYITRQHLETLLRLSTPSAEYIELYVYVHLVEDLNRGVYRYHSGTLEAIHQGDQRVRAAGLSLGQELAGTSCITISMIADFAESFAAMGERAYRQVHFEAGTIGQRLYLAAEATGLNCTGIGAFFDDEVNHYLDLDSPARQVVYHFAIGHKVTDSRLEAS